MVGMVRVEWGPSESLLTLESRTGKKIGQKDTKVNRPAFENITSSNLVPQATIETRQDLR